MDNKKAVPATGTANQNAQTNITPITPTNPRKIRALAALAHGDVMRYDLDGIIGTTNAPQYVHELIGDGWVITCERVPMTDRDGRNTMPGRYSLMQEQRQYVPRAGGDV